MQTIVLPECQPVTCHILLFQPLHLIAMFLFLCSDSERLLVQARIDLQGRVQQLELAAGEQREQALRAEQKHQQQQHQIEMQQQIRTTEQQELDRCVISRRFFDRVVKMLFSYLHVIPIYLMFLLI